MKMGSDFLTYFPLHINRQDSIFGLGRQVATGFQFVYLDVSHVDAIKGIG
jgi:hypothetical protein